jgi:hypothetical protein
METIKSNISIFWGESAAYVALYSVFALIVCAVVSGLEFHNQTSDLALTRIIMKGSILMLAAVSSLVLVFYVVSWHSKILGGEVLTTILLAVLWLVLMVMVNKFLMEWLGLSFASPVSYTFIPILVLISPFLIFHVFVFILGSAWN